MPIGRALSVIRIAALSYPAERQSKKAARPDERSVLIAKGRSWLL
jgi:hypothetical protein